MSLTKNLEHLPPLKHTKVHPPSSTQTNMEPMDGQTICTVHIVQEQEQQQLNCPQLQTIPQSYNNQDSMVLAQKQKYRSVVQDRMPRDKPTHIWTPNLRQRRQEYTMEKRQPLE